jgi:transcriptional regulator with XRE-family HTH domain
VLVHNISATGLLLESEMPLGAGEKLEVVLPHVGACTASVVWDSGRLFGCRFEHPISPAALSAAQLRSAVEPTVRLHGQGGAQPDAAFGLRLQRLRKERGMTLSRIASELGVSKPTVWAWEHGKSRPVENRIDGLAELLGIERSELLSKSAAPAELTQLLSGAREQIAIALGVPPESVKITVEL